ncbi:MAG: 2-nitropropane dioxygenase, partial [Planctomycetota bacterium]
KEYEAQGWYKAGDTARRADYQIWCGPSMGAFNEWVSGTPLAAVENRRVTTVAHALMEGAARLVRAAALRRAGLALPPGLPDITPRLPARPATPTPARSPA